MIAAISHRDPNFYQFLQPQEVQDDLKHKIIDFFEDEVRSTFPLNSCKWSTFSFDIKSDSLN